MGILAFLSGTKRGNTRDKSPPPFHHHSISQSPLLGWLISSTLSRETPIQLLHQSWFPRSSGRCFDFWKQTKQIMFRLQLSRCLARKGTFAGTAVGASKHLRTAAVILPKPTQTRSLATVVSNEPPVCYLYIVPEWELMRANRRRIHFFRGTLEITLMRCMQHGERTLLPFMYLGMILFLESVLLTMQASVFF